MNLRAAFEIACSYTMIKGAADYVDEEARKVNQSSPRGTVNLMTIHQAKGLEFKCVIIPGLNEGILPHVNSLEQTILNLEEERR